MGKQNQGTKFLYRKSNCTVNTRSKTCSGASQFLSRSGIVQLKKRLPKTNYYVENGKVKRDLSIETDKCILRGYYKKKFGRFKRSKNITEIGTINVPNHDYQSCGDSIVEEHSDKTRINIDVTSLVVENLKDLLNDWIKKYLLNNNETKQKIETVLDSILHKLELQRNSSSCTYTLDIKVNDKNKLNSNKTKATKCVKCEKQSCQTVPVTGKHIKLISTLSIPRNIKRHGSTTSQYLKPATRKIRYKNVFLTISRSSTFLLNSSSFNLLNMSTKSLIKRCATYDSNEIKTCKKHEVVLLPKSSYTESMPDIIYQEKVQMDLDSKVYPNALEIEPVQSLVKSIYADDPANITSTDNNISRCKHDNYTMTDANYTGKNVKFPTHYYKLNWKKAGDLTETETFKCGNRRRKNSKTKTLPHGHKIRKTKSKKNHLQSLKHLSRKKGDSSNVNRKPNCNQNDNLFLKDIQGILKHFTHYTDSNNVKFDVKINVFPGLGNKMHDKIKNEKSAKNTAHKDNLTAAYNIMSTQVEPETKAENLITESQIHSFNISQKSQPKLISILDGALSQSKYVISKRGSYEANNNTTKSDNIKVTPTNISTGLEIANDISELRIIIRDLAITTEKFVKEHLEHFKNKPNIKEAFVKEKSSKIGLNLSTVSKAVQYSNNKSPITSGLKLKKEPKKKDMQEFYSLAKKSISYNVIESESILKVTDMTSIVAEKSTDMLINKTLNYSLPKSKSQFEISLGQSKKKLLAYYCDELIKSRQFVQNRNPCCTCSSNTYKYTKCPDADKNISELINENKCHEDDTVYEGPQLHVPFNEEDCEINGPDYSSSSVYIDVEDRKKFAVRSRSGMSFWEGLIYCVLLWIPVVLIFWLIYIYVIKDMIQPKTPVIGRTVLPSQRSSNSSLFHITLSDLGF